MSFQVNYVYDLVDKMTPKIRKIQSNFKQSTDAIKRSTASAGESFGKMSRKLENVGKTAGEVGKKMFIRATLPLTLLGRSFVNTASDYQESLNKVEVAFGSASGKIKKFADTAGQNFGIDRGTALDMAAMFGDMSTSMGISTDKAAELSSNLVGLAGDLSSFKNIRVEQAQTALAGVFTGETESLKKLGVVMTEANLQQFAMSKGISASIKNFTQAEKVLLRYAFVTEATKNAQGDFTRTSAGFANQSRILKSRYNDLKISLGNILLPAITKLIGVVIKLIEFFQRLSPGIQKAIVMFGGLAAVLPPLLIAFSLMLPALTAINAPLLIIIGGITSLAFVVKEAAEWVTNFDVKLQNLLNNLKFLKNNFGAVIDEIRGLFGADLDAEITAKMNQDFLNKVKKIEQFKNSQINNVPQINTSSQSIDASGTIRVDIGSGAPSGTKASFTPGRNSILGTGNLGAAN